MQYNYQEIEKKWQKIWKDSQVYKVSNQSDKPKCYVLDMFPYPSGAGLHVGHPLGYIASDIYARYKRLRGFNILHPMGFDAFGLPAEQYAIETGQHPAVTTEKNIARYKEQLENIGFCYDWSREVKTADPSYYKWTQWIFLQLYHAWYNAETGKAEPIATLVEKISDSATGATFCGGKFNAWAFKTPVEQEKILMEFRLAYRAESYVNWCEALGTVLANDEVVNGVSERGGHPVERRLMSQWFLRITSFAERLLSGLELVEFPESLKEMQKNWIGKSVGATINFACPSDRRECSILPVRQIDGNDELEAHPVEETKIKIHNSTAAAVKIEVFTTRPDTIFGASFLVLAPEHTLVKEITTDGQKNEIEDYIKYVSSRSERERMAETKVITGCFTGSFAIHPFSGQKLPIWISEYVLAGYGTGAIMAVPCGDERDFAFAKHFGLDIPNIFKDTDISEKACMDKNVILINSDFLDGLTAVDAIDNAVRKIEELDLGQKKINYRMRDAGFSRQRYWGEPFPIVYDETGIPYALTENELPVELPYLETYSAGPNGKGPLANAVEWVEFEGNVPDASSGLTPDASVGVRHLSSVLNTSPEGRTEVSDASSSDLTPNPSPEGEGGNGDSAQSFTHNPSPEGEGGNGDSAQSFTHNPSTKGGNDGASSSGLTPNPSPEGEGGNAVRPTPIFTSPPEIWKHLKAFARENRKNQTLAEQILWEELRNKKLGTKVRRQHAIDSYIADFYFSEYGLIIEIDGGYHDAIEQKKYDDSRKSILEEMGYKVLRYTNDEVENALESVLKNIKHELTTLTPLSFRLKTLTEASERGAGGEALSGNAHTSSDDINRPSSEKESALMFRETDTMPGYAGSSWYYLRYMDPHNEEVFCARSISDYWKQVDVYVGGAEHAVGHLLYSRMWCKALYDLGYIGFDEPYKKLINQGMIQGNSRLVYRIKGTNTFVSYGLKEKYDVDILYTEYNFCNGLELDISKFKDWKLEYQNAEFILEDGKYFCGSLVEKMSKRLYNVVNPDDIIAQYGADTFRMYEMFLGPLEVSKPWDTKGIEGVHRFLRKLWRLYFDENMGLIVTGEPASKEEFKILHKTIKKISHDTENFAFNTAVSQFMITVNELSALDCHKKEILEPLLILLSPYAPHISEELWAALGNTGSILDTTFPLLNEALLVENSFTYPIAIQGKARTEMEFALDLSSEEIQAEVLKNEIVMKWMDGKPLKKLIYVKGKMINIVI